MRIIRRKALRNVRPFQDITYGACFLHDFGTLFMRIRGTDEGLYSSSGWAVALDTGNIEGFEYSTAVEPVVDAFVTVENAFVTVENARGAS